MQPHYSSLANHWKLDETITFLNHGSFGATPIKILEKQHSLREEMEKELVKFYIREYEFRWDEARIKTAEFLSSKPTNLVFVKNATQGVNTIFHSLNFNEGDEILTTSHAYGACVNMMHWYAQRYKLKVAVADIPFPIKNDDEIITAIEQKITDKTRLALIDHITSPTGLIFPIEKIIDLLHSKNVEVLVDGAHAPGMLDLNLEKLNADYYVGNCHKWICSPKGSAVLWVNEQHHHKISPLQISHAYQRNVSENEKWVKNFYWPGTDDNSGYLCVPDSINYMAQLFPDGWKDLRKNNRELTLKGRKLIAEKMNLELPAPDHMIGSLGALLLGKTNASNINILSIHPLQEELFNQYKIEVPVFIFPRNNAQLCLRIACQAYNDSSQYAYLAECLEEIKAKKPHLLS